jgi:anti-sigma-K factor RskA
MQEEIERARKLGIAERSLGGWRVVAAAWSVAVIFVVLFATGEALASRHGTSPHEGSLAGAVIPQHDPSVPGSNEMAASDWLERVRAEAYSGL